MRTTIRTLTLAGLLLGTIAGVTTAGAQPNRRRVVVQRAQVAGVRADDGRCHDRIVARRAVMRERIRNMTPEQRTAFQAQRQALRTERQAVGAQLRAGTITREQAQTRMRAWREQHPSGFQRPPRRGPGGEF